MKSFFVFAFGFGAGWAVRSLADSPHGVGVKLAEVAHRAKGHVNKWAATERERIVDIIAEGRFRAEQKNVFGKAKPASEQDQKIA